LLSIASEVLSKNYTDFTEQERYDAYMTVTDPPANSPEVDQAIASMARKYGISERNVLQILQETFSSHYQCAKIQTKKKGQDSSWPFSIILTI